MTEMYIRRSGGVLTRRRLLALTLGAILLAAGLMFGLRAWRGAGEPEEAPPLGPAPGAVEPPPATSPGPNGTPGTESPAIRPAPPSLPPNTVQATPPADPDAPDPGVRLIAAAEQLAEQGDWLAARERAWQTLEQSTHEPALDRARTLLGTLHTELVTTPRSMPEKVEYVVQPGDSLAKLAQEFNTTIELIQRGNNISGSMIRIGDRLRIFQAAFHAHIDKSDNLLDLYANGRFFKRYPVGTGEYNRTPVGDFKITDRIHQPTWWRPDGKAIPYGDPENELGTHWLSLDVRGYGLHGTWEPETIGRQASAGCVRLSNDHIAELYMLLPVGSTVTIVD